MPTPLCMNVFRMKKIADGDIMTSLLGVKAAQKLRIGFTVWNVWLPEISCAKRVASWKNLSCSSEVSVGFDLSYDAFITNKAAHPSEKNIRFTRLCGGPERRRHLIWKGGSSALPWLPFWTISLKDSDGERKCDNLRSWKTVCDSEKSTSWRWSWESLGEIDGGTSCKIPSSSYA